MIQKSFHVGSTNDRDDLQKVLLIEWQSWPVGPGIYLEGQNQYPRAKLLKQVRLFTSFTWHKIFTQIFESGYMIP